MALDKQQKQRLPSMLKRSPSKAQATYVHTLEAAEETHGDGEGAHRIAFASLERSFERVGDHWEPKDERGPSDDQDAKRGAEASQHPTETNEGVNARASKTHLMEVAARLGIRRRMRMTKDELVDAVQRANRQASTNTLEADRARAAR